MAEVTRKFSSQCLPLVKVSTQEAFYFFSNYTLKNVNIGVFRTTLGLLCKLVVENHWQPAVTIMVDYFLEPFLYRRSAKTEEELL